MLVNAEGLSHDLVDVALGCAVGAIGWLFDRAVRRIEMLDERQKSLSQDIAATRNAVSRIEGHLDLDPYPYGS